MASLEEYESITEVDNFSYGQDKVASDMIRNDGVSFEDEVVVTRITE